MGSWTSDATLLDLMRSVVVATNRLRYAEAKAEVDELTMTALRRSHRAATEALEEAFLTRGWQIPGSSRMPRPRAALSF
ncbi:MAG: hypothetical protein QOG53_2723 [Frankiales bacterium]|jgi:hypothetical protein|nr:hypothetical protein [Frankiales bacterium]